MDNPLLYVLVDGWRHDMLSEEATPFLARAATGGKSGSVVEPFGFAPGPAIFAGLWPEQAGYTHKFHFDPDRSPYRFLRWIPDFCHRLPRGSKLLEDWVQRRASRVLRDRGSTLPESVWEMRHVPVALRRFFDLSEFHRADAPGAFKTPGLFDQLRAEGIPYLYLGAPETTLETQAVLTAADARLTGGHRLVFAHFGEPDWVAHRAGPGSADHLRVLRDVDLAVARLSELVESRTGLDVNLLAFGDHGFLPVRDSVDVAGALDALPLVEGQDYVAFLDSTTARFWFPCEDPAPAQRLLAEALDSLDGLTRLLPAQQLRYRAEFNGPQNWQACWVAEPEIVIYPDYFGGIDGATVLGMHGYRPEVRANHAAWMLSGPAADSSEPAEPLAMADLFGICCHALGLEGPPRPAASTARHYTVHADPTIDARIESDLQWITSRLLERMPELEGLLLTGGFARGEGTVVSDGEGGVRPFNDYDLVVLHPDTPERAELIRYGRTLADPLGFRHLDLLPFDRRELIAAGPQMFFVDLRAEGRVLHGDPALLGRMPPFPPGSLPVTEAHILLFNRLTCGLEDSSQALLEDRESSAAARFACDYMSAKLVVCAAHATLAREGRHALTLRDCIDGFAGREAHALVSEYGWFKLDPIGRPLRGSSADHWFAARDFYLDAIGEQLGVSTGDPAALIQFTRDYCRWSGRNWLRLGLHRCLGATRKASENWAAHRRRDIEAAELLLMAAPRREGHESSLLVEAARRLAPHVEVPGRDWDDLRRQVVECDYSWLHPIR